MRARDFLPEQLPDPQSWNWQHQYNKQLKNLLSPEEIEQMEYLSGKCAILAIALHQLNPQRFHLGIMIEYFDTVPDLRPDEQDWDDLPGERKFDLMYNSKHWVMGHAFVHDKQTDEYIDARGRFPTMAGVQRGFSTHSKLGRTIFPTTVEIAAKVGTVEMTDQGVQTVKGQEYLDRFVDDNAQKKALNYAKKHLGIDS